MIFPNQLFTRIHTEIPPFLLHTYLAFLQDVLHLRLGQLPAAALFAL